jgi:hypothetical protein
MGCVLLECMMAMIMCQAAWIENAATLPVPSVV